MADSGALYICGTPIGNLKDVTLRLLDILKEVNIIAAEDTRRTKKLLNKYEIDTPLTSYHEHNEKQKSRELIKKLREGQEIALVSDAGMPGISDPGYEVINRAVANGIEITSVPGPTALISALVVSGLPMDRFSFQGFLPRKGKEREKKLEEIKKSEITTIIYESPKRVQKTLKEFENIIKNREIALVRELTKLHEEKIYGSIPEVINKIEDKKLKGEIVIVISGREKTEVEEESWQDLSILEHVKLFMRNGYTKKEAIKEVAQIRDLPKSEVYEEAIAISVNKEEI